MPQDVTDLVSVRRIAKIAPAVDDTVVEQAWRAAEAFVAARTSWDETVGTPPADLVQAVALLTARYLARQNSPDGLVGVGDLGMVRVAGVDRDVDRLIAPWRIVVLA